MSPVVALAQPMSDEVRSGDTLWSVPKFAMLDLMQSSDGTIFILAKDSKKDNFLLVGANEAGPGRRLPLADSSSMPESNLRLVEGVGDTLWIGGTKNQRRSISGPLSDAYLAKIDREGHVMWDLDIARNRENAIQDLASMPTGDLLIAGKEDDRNWLARFSKDGKLVWEKTFGLGKIASVAVMNDAIVVAAFEASETSVAERGQAQVAVWRLSYEGELLAHQIVRDDIAQSPNSLWLMKVISKRGAIYVFSAWTEERTNPRLSRPLSIVKMDTQGHLLWQKKIADTIFPTRIGLLLCVNSVAVLADGSALVDCRTEEGIKFIRLDAETGEATQSFLPNLQRSNCDGLFGWSAFMIQKSEKVLWIFGNGGGCTWLQRKSLEN
jgi:hypothetical protein